MKIVKMRFRIIWQFGVKIGHSNTEKNQNDQTKEILKWATVKAILEVLNLKHMLV